MCRAPAGLRQAPCFRARFPRSAPNSYAFETTPLVKPTGFREYDARWWYGIPGDSRAPELNLTGVTALGLGLGTLLHELGAGPEVVTGHDYRSYSAAIQGGARQWSRRRRLPWSTTSALAVTPMAYFAQFALDVPAVAMVTASHNENGWTGIKMGAARPLTFGPRRDGAAEGDRAFGRIRPPATAAPIIAYRTCAPATLPT